MKYLKHGLINSKRDFLLIHLVYEALDFPRSVLLSQFRSIFRFDLSFSNVHCLLH